MRFATDSKCWILKKNYKIVTGIKKKFKQTKKKGKNDEAKFIIISNAK